MLIKTIRWAKDYRCFPAGHSLELKDRVTVIVGDNGAGKSTLLGLLRGQFKSHWTPSSLSGRDWEDAIRVEPPVPAGEPLTYIDLAADHMSSRSEFDTEHLDVQVAAMQKSSGQAAMVQLSGIMKQTRARVHIIDEPERGLSPMKQLVVATMLREIISERPEDQFLITTHSRPFMETLTEEVLLLPEGRHMPVEDYLLLAETTGLDLAARYVEARKKDRDEAAARAAL